MSKDDAAILIAHWMDYARKEVNDEMQAGRIYSDDQAENIFLEKLNNSYFLKADDSSWGRLPTYDQVPLSVVRFTNKIFLH